jgi:hypothetical protein
MNMLKLETQAQVVQMLTEGCSIRSTERLTGVHRDTIMRLSRRVGAACARLHDEMMHDLPCRRVELDELWTFIRKKQRWMKPGDDPCQTGDAWR